MTQEEIDNLQIGDVYERIDKKEIRIIYAISNDCIAYKAFSTSWNYKSDLLDYNYRLIGKSNNNMNTFNIEPGMVLITAEKLENARNKDTYIAFPDGNDGISAVNLEGDGWVHVKSFMRAGSHEIYYVLNRPSDNIRDGKVLWRREAAIKEMTIAEIEQKLGIAAGSLRIKK